MKYYQVSVQHDRGYVTLFVSASNRVKAMQIVCNAEGCPMRAITYLKEISKKQTYGIMKRNNPGKPEENSIGAIYNWHGDNKHEYYRIVNSKAKKISKSDFHDLYDKGLKVNQPVYVED